MKTTDYEALLEKRYATPADIAQRKDAGRLADIARNAESLIRLAEDAAEIAADAAGASPAYAETTG